MKEHRFKIPPGFGGRRLDTILAELMAPELSRAQAQRLIKEGLVTLEGREARASAWWSWCPRPSPSSWCRSPWTWRCCTKTRTSS
ncbi:MAG: hypothetical protein K9K66_11510 [Desulfarculaceae bacterium]|nr:hypothetical protein [Desulfarculaceae bacterium]